MSTESAETVGTGYQEKSIQKNNRGYTEEEEASENINWWISWLNYSLTERDKQVGDDEEHGCPGDMDKGKQASNKEKTTLEQIGIKKEQWYKKRLGS